MIKTTPAVKMPTGRHYGVLGDFKADIAGVVFNPIVVFLLKRMALA